jgi:hypothetical protein
VLSHCTTLGNETFSSIIKVFHASFSAGLD